MVLGTTKCSQKPNPTRALLDLCRKIIRVLVEGQAGEHYFLQTAIQRSFRVLDKTTFSALLDTNNSFLDSILFDINQPYNEHCNIYFNEVLLWIAGSGQPISLPRYQFIRSSLVEGYQSLIFIYYFIEFTLSSLFYRVFFI